MTNKPQLVVCSEPKLFEPFLIDAWTDESAEKLAELLRTQKGVERGDLILLLAKRDIGDFKLPQTWVEKAIGKEPKTTQLVEWFSSVFRWNGLKWKAIFPGSVETLRSRVLSEPATRE